MSPDSSWVSPATISARYHHFFSFHNSLRSLVDRFPLATRLLGNVLQQDLPIQMLPPLCWRQRVCVWLNYPFHYLLFPGWKKSCKMYDVSGSPIADILHAPNFCLCKRSAITATLLASLHTIHQQLRRGLRNANIQFWYERVLIAWCDYEHVSLKHFPLGTASTSYKKDANLDHFHIELVQRALKMLV